MSDLISLSEEELKEAAKLSFQSGFMPDETEMIFERERIESLIRRFNAIAQVIDNRKEKEIAELFNRC